MKTLYLILLMFIPLIGMSQEQGHFLCRTTIFEGDTIPLMDLPTVVVTANRIYVSEEERLRYTKLIRDVKKAYPYAKLAGAKIIAYNTEISKIYDKKRREQVLEQAEEKLKAEFSADIKKMTFSQGRILIKLIYRETGNTSFEVIKQLRGGFEAFVWQALARMFGNNLKSEYDPSGDDRMIEQIITLIENGDL